MKSFSWLKSLSRRTNGQARRPIRRSTRLGVEALEDRTVPAQFWVTSNLDDGGAGTLRAAIAQANSSVGLDEIVFASGLSGSITLTGGQLTITDNLNITGPGAVQLAVSGNHVSRIFEIGSGVTAAISGLNIRDGVTGAHGGGIYNAGTLTLSNSWLTSNTANTDFPGYSGFYLGFGGGIYNTGALTVSGCNISGNSINRTHSNNTGGAGGGIYNLGTLTVRNSTFAGNSGDQVGGAICTSTYDGEVLVSDSTFTVNSAGIGGGIAVNYTKVMTINASTFTRNSAGQDGGGIFISNFPNTTLTIKNSTLAVNSAGHDGGGLYTSDYGGGNVEVQEVSLAGNTAGNDGGGMWGNGRISNSTLIYNSAGNDGGGMWGYGRISNSTLVNNSAGHDGGGLYSTGGVLTNVTITANRSNTLASGGSGGGLAIGPYSYGYLVLNNTIVARNFNGPTPGTTASDIAGTLDTFSAFNLIGTGGSGGLQDRSADPVRNNQVGVAAPGLGGLGNYGGSTQTIPLLSGSPAIAGGSRALAVAAAPIGVDDNSLSPLTTDQRGPGFARLYNSTVDIGSFQSQLAPPRTTLTVSNANDSGPGSLRQSVQANNLLGGGNTIAFALPAGTTITLSGGELLVIQDVTISGPGAAQLALSGNNAGRVFAMYFGGLAGGLYAVGSTSSISGLTIKNGAAGTSQFGGGSVYLQAGTLTVNDCAFSGNSASNGGAIYSSGSLIINGSTFTGNSATYGGAIYNDNTLTVSGSSFTGNSADDGGGIAGFFGQATIRNSAFSSNRSSYGGGGLYFGTNSGDLTVSNSIFSGNLTGGDGGGVAFSGNRLMVGNSTFAGNSSNGLGGGIYYGGRNSNSTLTNVTIAGNNAGAGGGIYILGTRSTVLRNTIVARNTAGSGPDVEGRILSRGYNLIGYISGIFRVGSGLTGTTDDGVLFILPGALGDKVSIDASNPINPVLAPLGDYGGSTRTMPPLLGSPALDAGGNTMPVGIPGAFPTSDQRGFQRIVNGTVDIGAAEYQGSQDPAYEGVSVAVENAAPNGGDGNGDGILDSLQANVTSLPNAATGSYVTLQSFAGTSLAAVQAVANPPPGVLPDNAQTPVGQFDFQVHGLASRATTTVTLYMPAGVKVNQYWKYGLEPTDDPKTLLNEMTTPHWWEFKWNGATGAQFVKDINGFTTKIVLTFVDGGRGDDDLLANGIIVDPGVPVQMDPATLLPSGRLMIVGTDGNDDIKVNPGGGSAEIKVNVNGQQWTFVGVTEIVIYGLAGNDDIQVAGGISLSAWLYGGDGNDRLKGGGGNNVILGGDGDDLLVGGNDRDILIGGIGADRIVGNAADDILIAGATAFDGNENALYAILAEWTSGRSYAIRVANLSGTGSGPEFEDRLNGNNYLRVTDQAATTTVFDDGDEDVLTGSAGQDWFFANLVGTGVKDRITDLSASEFANDLKFIYGP